MNRRQAKKLYKKRYGQSPQKTFNEICSLYKPGQIEAIYRAIEQTTLALQKLAEEAIETFRKMIEGKREANNGEVH